MVVRRLLTAIQLKPGEDGGLDAEYAVQPGALLQAVVSYPTEG